MYGSSIALYLSRTPIRSHRILPQAGAQRSDQPGVLGGIMEESDPTSRRTEAVAGHGGRRIFLSYVVRTQLISLFDIYVWLGNLARLSLLLRSRDVGHRNLLRAAAGFPPNLRRPRISWITVFVTSNPHAIT